MEKILEFASRREAEAFKALDESHVKEIWETAGAEVRLVGSLRMGLLCRHRDIDLHIYSEGITEQSSFATMAEIAKNPRIIEIKCINGLHTEERCIAWHAKFKASDDAVWQLDMIHIEKGTVYDGFFEEMADRIKALLTPELRHTILKLKFDTPEDEEIHGVEYYQGVMEGNATTLDELRRWLVAHRATPSSTYWMPSKP